MLWLALLLSGLSTGALATRDCKIGLLPDDSLYYWELQGGISESQLKALNPWLQMGRPAGLDFFQPSSYAWRSPDGNYARGLYDGDLLNLTPGCECAFYPTQPSASKSTDAFTGAAVDADRKATPYGNMCDCNLSLGQPVPGVNQPANAASALQALQRSCAPKASPPPPPSPPPPVRSPPPPPPVRSPPPPPPLTSPSPPPPPHAPSPPPPPPPLASADVAPAPAAASGAATTAGGAAAALSPPAGGSSGDSSGGSNAGAIAGAAVGAAAVAGLAVAGGYLLWRRRGRKAAAAHSAGAVEPRVPAGLGSVPPRHPGPTASLASRAPGGASAAVPTAAAAAAGAADAWTVAPPHAAPAPLASEPPAAATAASGSYSYSSGMASRHLSLAHDPLLSYISSIVASGQAAAAAAPASCAQGGVNVASAAAAGPAGGGLVARRPGAFDAQHWLVEWGELEVQQPIGKGSFGAVYLATWNQTPVAVKVLLAPELQGSLLSSGGGGGQQALSLSDRAFEKLEQEAGLMSQLRHPCVVQFMAVCALPAALVTEYCSRGSLFEVLQAGRRSSTAAAELSWTRRLAMALDGARGLLYLHSRNVVHRDLKSPNLLVDGSWHAKVSDFNLSKLVAETSYSTSAGAMNPRWLAPEVLGGQSASPAADVFAFGVVLWELVTWELPWADVPNPWTIAAAVVAGGRPELPPLSALPGGGGAAAPGINTYLALMRRCWAQDPGQRPGFADVAQELKSLLEAAQGGQAHVSVLPSGARP